MTAQLVAHRGASTIRPENTLAAFHAAQTLGVDAIEFDVHSTHDGTLVVHHDYLLDRTTSGSGPIHEHGAAYVRALDAGSWFDPAYVGEQVPLLDEVLSLAGLEFELELKGFTRAHMRAVAETVHAHGAMNRTEITSWHLPMLLALKDQYPDARLGLFSRRREQWMPDSVFEDVVLAPTEFGAFDVIHVYAADVSPDLVTKIHDRGLIAHANDAANNADIECALRAEVDRFSTDDVELGLTVLERHGDVQEA